MKKNRLLEMIAKNFSGKEAREIRMESTDTEVHIYLYDVIDSWFGANASALIEKLTAADGKTVHLHVNSPGGDVFEARAMAAAISSYSGDVIAHNDGVVASAATYPLLAAREVRMSNGAMFMIHNSMTLAYGNKADLTSAADLLEKIDQTIAATYVQKTGKTLEQVAAWMSAETWFTAQEALDAGFADVIEVDTKSEKNWDLSVYENAPQIVPVQGTEEKLSEEISNLMQRNRNRMRLLQI